MRARDAITTLEELGSSQWGLVTTAQAEDFEISRVALGRLRDDHIIHRVRRGVWALPSADHGPFQDLRAAWLSTGARQLAHERLVSGDVVVSHLSAASVHGLGDHIPRQYEFIAATRRQTTQADLRFHRAAVGRDVAVVDGLPVTSIPRTVEDLAGSMPDLDHLSSIIRDALGSPEVHPRDLARRLGTAATHLGYGGGDALVEDALERAGLPAVATNLSGSRAMSRLLAGTAVPSIDKDLLEALTRQLQSPELRAAIRQAEEIFLALQQSPALDNARTTNLRMQSIVRETVVPILERNAQIAQPIIENFRSQWDGPVFRLGGTTGEEPVTVSSSDDVEEDLTDHDVTEEEVGR